MFNTCGWCGEPAGGSHAACSVALREVADERHRAARGAALLAQAMLEEAAILHAAASAVEPLPSVA